MYHAKGVIILYAKIKLILDMSEKKFHRDEYPLDILAEFGLSEQMVYDLPDFVHETIEFGGMSPLLPLEIEQPFGYTRLYAKFCLVETDEGIDVLFSPKLKEANLEMFSEQERKLLQDGKVVVSDVEESFVTNEGEEDVQRIKAFVQLDMETNSVVYTPTQVIGRNLKNVSEKFEVSYDDLKNLLNGNIVTVSEENEDGVPEYITIGVDLFSDKGVVLVPGQSDRWLRTVRKTMPEYSFGNDGCWINKHGALSYVSEENFTKEILDVMEQQAKQAGIEMESHHIHESSENGLGEEEEESRQITGSPAKACGYA